MDAFPLFGCVRALRDEGLSPVWPASERDRRGAGLRVVLRATGMPLRAGSKRGPQHGVRAHRRGPWV
jgi:hypothetical protein